MTYSKLKRQQTLAELIRGSRLSTQENLAARLSASGYKVTQATISRDLEQIGALKIRRAGQYTYALPDQGRPTGARAIDKVIHEWVLSIEATLNLIVMKTPAGSAHLIGVALDQQTIPEIVGTVCGDDTIFVACRSVKAASALAKRLGAMADRLTS